MPPSLYECSPSAAGRTMLQGALCRGRHGVAHERKIHGPRFMAAGHRWLGEFVPMVEARSTADSLRQPAQRVAAAKQDGSGEEYELQGQPVAGRRPDPGTTSRAARRSCLILRRFLPSLGRRTPSPSASIKHDGRRTRRRGRAAIASLHYRKGAARSQFPK